MWVIGQLTKEELAELRQRGWKDEDPPEDFSDPWYAGPDPVRMFYVNNDLFKVMSGSDWDKERTEPEPLPRPVVTFPALCRVVGTSDPPEAWTANQQMRVMSFYRSKDATVITLLENMGLEPRNWSIAEKLNISKVAGIPVS